MADRFTGKLTDEFGTPKNPATEETLEQVQDNTLLDSYTRGAFELDDGIRLLVTSGKNPRVKANGNRQLVSEVFFGHPSEGTVYTHSTADVQFFVNSTVAGDNKTVVVTGWKSDGTAAIGIATLNGLTQVALSSTFRYVHILATVTADPSTGDVYVAESTAIDVNGVPTDATKVRGFMRQIRQNSFNPILVAEPNKKITFFDLQGTTDATKDVETGFEVKNAGTNYFKVIIENHIYQNSFNLIRHPSGVLAAGDVLQITAKTQTENASITQGFAYLEIDITIIT